MVTRLRIDEAARIFQVLRADRVGGPERERCDRAGWIVARVLRERARAEHKHAI